VKLVVVVVKFGDIEDGVGDFKGGRR